MTPILITLTSKPLAAIAVVAFFVLLCRAMWDFWTGEPPCLHCGRDFERAQPGQLLCGDCDRLTALWRKPRSFQKPR